MNNLTIFIFFLYFCNMKPSFMIAAPTSGSGKTTIARGLMALLTQKGYKVQPFKCGPDYIDTKFHEAVCGRPSINLDTFMATKDHVRELFSRYGSDSDICVVEGMMGLFDGYDRDKGSSAEIAATLGIPVVLAVDAKSAAYSVAPLLQGFVNFRRDVRIAGVIFNKVGSERHYRMLKEVCADLNIECFGYLPKHPLLEQGSRYLGLDFSEKAESTALVSLLEEHVNWQQLVGEASKLCSCTQNNQKSNGTAKFESIIHCAPQFVDMSITSDKLPDNLVRDSKQYDAIVNYINSNPLRVLIARNMESFSFIYQETIDSLGDVTFFDPEKDVPDLNDIDLLYLPGGYPEKHLEALVSNVACRNVIKEYAERGGRIIAECGGMMYLCRSIVGEASPTTEYPMCGVLPCVVSSRKADRKLSLGYRRFELNCKEYRGHEFHYTQFIGERPQSVTQVYNAKGEPVDTPVFKYKNVLASYTHLYNIDN